MKPLLLLPATLLATIALWALLSWPLPAHMFHAIPVSAHGTPEQQLRYMVPGDHLQLLYYFELYKEWLTGSTPWFYNLYEFNTGDDEERFIPGGYYLPFSLFYTAGRLIGGQAFGFNLAAVVSLWLTVLATWYLVRRYINDVWAVFLMSSITILLPYRWKALFDASPTGFAMMWMPVLFLGLDIAVREGKARGGVLAGLSILFAYLADLHVFFFSVLVAPAWCLFALFAGRTAGGGDIPSLGRTAKAMIPLAVCAILVVFVVRMQTSELQETKTGDGRGIGEVASFSPSPMGLFVWQDSDISSQVFLGYTLPTLVALGILAAIIALLRRHEEQRNAYLILLLSIGLALTVVLALGPHGPLSGRFFHWARELIPPYAMIRQAGKIFSVMPTLFAVAGSLSLSLMFSLLRLQPVSRYACLFLVLTFTVLEFARVSYPAITMIRDEQPAYAAVAEDAAQEGMKPRALVVTLWPGDSHFASIYQHFAIMYRVKMVNGYKPSISKSYFEEIFLPFVSINQGFLSDEQITELFRRDIRYILLHEDIYPEKVAPFPVTYAIQAFLNHPRLTFLGQGDRVWAFKILNDPLPRAPLATSWATFFPARHWEMERSRMEGGDVLEGSRASGKHFIRLSVPESSVTLQPRSAPPAHGLHWLVRVRGVGTLKSEVFADEELISRRNIQVQAPNWEWFDVPAATLVHKDLSLRLSLLEGFVELDSALLTAGEWIIPALNQSITIPAPSFFHAGYSDLGNDRVVILKSYEEERIVFYGPKLPLDAGTYEVEILFSSGEYEGVELGVVNLEHDWNTGEGIPIRVIAGQPAVGQVDLRDNLPFNLAFIYFGRADMSIDGVRITRLR